MVKGFLTTLSDHWDDIGDEERRQMIGSAARGGDRLGRLVDDLFAAARLESGALEVRPTRIELGAVVAEAVTDLGADGVTVVTGPVHVLADRGRVQQMVTNYVTNALRYGGAPVTVEVTVVDGGAQVVVEDSGPGISDALAPLLFTKFASGGTREATGLGLFIVRELARAQGGAAWHQRAPGGGAAFYLRLPLAP